MIIRNEYIALLVYILILQVYSVDSSRVEREQHLGLREGGTKGNGA